MIRYNGTLQIREKIDPNDGHRSDPIWEVEKKNSSTYDNVWMDIQCSVPIVEADETVNR